MNLGFDQKEDLRLRMVELEKKLAESEEERCKLEKTCNVLIRAFREEEKMRYKALNKKYEKFLENCSLRRRRNDIILKSLCRIEDRARALFAKTERLKILKDRYISSLKFSEFKKEEPAYAWKNFPPSQKIHDVTSKSVRWKSPSVADVMAGQIAKEFTEPEGIYSYSSTGGSFNEPFRENKENFFENILSHETLGCNKLDERGKYRDLGYKAPSDRINASDNQCKSEGNFENYKSHTYLENTYLNRQNAFDDDANYIQNSQNTNFLKEGAGPEPNVRILDEGKLDYVAARREKVSVTHQESIEKLKKALSIEEDIENDNFEIGGDTQKIIEKDEIEMNEKNISKTDNNQLGISQTDTGPCDESKNDECFDETVVKPENLPVGLDGVDYQNETYPESYYEQPVHHNHTSIASDVILEEDETEQDIDHMSDDGEKNALIRKWSDSDSDVNKYKGASGQACPEKQFGDSPDNAYDEAGEFKSHEIIKTDNFDSDERSKKSDSTVRSEKGAKRPQQSNLLHLLESDSESFQIEHGDLAAGNEDSDFDFSFNQNTK